MKKWMMIVAGLNSVLLLGNLILVACGTSNASSPISAGDIAFDNTGTGLEATTLQEAIAELAGRVGDGSAAAASFDNTDTGLTATTVQGAIAQLAESLEEVRASDLSSKVAGTWTGTEKDENVLDQNYPSAVAVTFNSNGTYSCTSFGRLNDYIAAVCDSPISWTVSGKVIELTYDPGMLNASGKVELPIQYVGDSAMTLLDGDDDIGMRVMFLTKT